MVEGFLWSDEFLGFFDDAGVPNDIGSDDFILHMYENVFGREPDPMALSGGSISWILARETRPKSSST